MAYSRQRLARQQIRGRAFSGPDSIATASISPDVNDPGYRNITIAEELARNL